MALRSTLRLRLSVFGGMAALMLGGVLLAFWPFIAAERRLQAFCDAQPAGTSLAQLQAGAQQQGYGLATLAPGVVQVDDPAGFGRRQCQLALDSDGRVRRPPADR